MMLDRSRMPEGWSRRASILRPRVPAFWLLLLLLLFGALFMGAMGALALVTYPTGSILALALLTGYTIPFFIVLYRLDLFEREPFGIVAVAFLWGGLVATSFAIPGNEAISALSAKIESPAFAADWSAALAGPTTEEILKLLGLVVIVLIAREEIDTPLDGFVYGGIIGLGFQVVENFLYAVNGIDMSGGDQIGPVIGIFVLRGFFAGLWSHAMYTALAGYGVGWAVVHHDRPRWQRLLVAGTLFLAAWGLHFIWNSPWLTDAFGDGAAVLLSLPLKGLPGLLFFVALYLMARNHDARWIRAALAPEVGSTVISAQELEALTTIRGRRAARKRAKREGGRAARRLTRQLQHAQVNLALALIDDSPRAGEWRERVAALRDARDARIAARRR